MRSAGKVGFTLGKYMAERNVCVSGYYSQSRESAIQASNFTHTRYYETLEELTASSDALFLTVSDGAIEEVWNSLKEYSLKGKFICHCSGAMNSAVFSGLTIWGHLVILSILCSQSMTGCSHTKRFHKLILQLKERRNI